MKKITAGGLSLTAEEWSDELGISVTAVRYRLKKWGTGERFFAEPKQTVAVTINGVRYRSIEAAAKAHGIRGHVVRKRYMAGLRDGALVAYRRPGRPRKLET